MNGVRFWRGLKKERDDDMSRFFVEDRNIIEDEILIDNEQDIHHIARVLRLKPGALIDVSDSREWEYHGQIISLSPDKIKVKILDKQKFAREPNLRVTLFQGIPKQGKMEGIIQKSVELGAASIVPVFMTRTITSEKGNIEKKVARWQKVAGEAVKQCKRGIIPQIDKAISFEAMLEWLTSEASGYELIVFPYENEEEHTIKQALRALQMIPKQAAVIIGPEGGFSDEEAEALKEIGSKCVSLGKAILRTETAGPTAIAMIMYELEL